MSLPTAASLKALFETGDHPSAADFATLIDGIFALYADGLSQAQTIAASQVCANQKWCVLNCTHERSISAAGDKTLWQLTSKGPLNDAVVVCSTATVGSNITDSVQVNFVTPFVPVSNPASMNYYGLIPTAVDASGYWVRWDFLSYTTPSTLLSTRALINQRIVFLAL